MPHLDLGRIEQQVRSELDAKFQSREAILQNSRRTIQMSANAIRAIHRGDFADAEDLMNKAEVLLDETSTELADHPDLNAGFAHDAAKEYAEARLTFALFQNREVPDHHALGVPVASYLNGLGEAVGELRRRLLDQLRSGDVPAAEDTFTTMDEVMDLLVALDYPDGMTGGLRRTTDVARQLIERSRADLATTIVQERLRAELAKE
ncbi:MAG: haloacid dehalogenase [Acidimicrobiia bacterium]